jgi:hypothetical protein
MRQSLWVVVWILALASCRPYDLDARLDHQGGALPPDQFARYGREQAQAVAIGREYAHAESGSSPAELEKQAETAINYARSLPDVTDIQADPLGHRLTIRFRSGWLTMVNPIDDGKRGAETPGLPAAAAAAETR